MSLTLAGIRDNVIRKTDRDSSVSQANVEAEISAAVRFYSRRGWAFTEKRDGTITTTADYAWYSTADFTSAAGGPAGLTEVLVSDILDIDLITIPAGNARPLMAVSYDEFKMLQVGEAETSDSISGFCTYDHCPGGCGCSDDETCNGEPTKYVRYGERIGFYPTPNEAYTIRISGNVKPIIPTDPIDYSVFFDEAQELIESHVCERIYKLYVGDLEMAAMHADERESQASMLDLEQARKRSIGRTKARN